MMRWLHVRRSHFPVSLLPNEVSLWIYSLPRTDYDYVDDTFTAPFLSLIQIAESYRRLHRLRHPPPHNTSQGKRH